MTREERVGSIRKLERARKSKVIALVTGDRQSFVTQLADDGVRLLHEHLEGMRKQRKISLFLYTRGGALMAPLRMVLLIREYCEEFEVVVPYRAHSAGTLTCLGADKIVMGRLAELTPVDPSTANDFNPQNPLSPAVRIPISVEDVTAYLALAKKQAELTSESTRLEVFKALTSQINAIALGNVQRVYTEIRELVETLLGLHMTSQKERSKIPAIVKTLTERYTHDYLIPRREAGKIGLKVEIPNDRVESLMTVLFSAYEKDLALRDPFNPEALLGSEPRASFSYETAYVESVVKTHAFVQSGEVTRTPGPIQLPGQIPVPGLEQVTIRLMKQKWEEIP